MTDQSLRGWDMSKRVLAALGAVVGPIIGYFTVFCFKYASMEGNCMQRFAAFATGLVFGVPIGGIVFCLFGFWLGSAWDKQSGWGDTPPQEPTTTPQ